MSCVNGMYELVSIKLYIDTTFDGRRKFDLKICPSCVNDADVMNKIKDLANCMGRAYAELIRNGTEEEYLKTLDYARGF